MSYHMRIMPSRPEAAGAGRREKTPVTIGLESDKRPRDRLASSGRQGHRPARRLRGRALRTGRARIHNVPHSDDIEGNLGILRQLGVDIWEAADTSYRDRRPRLAGPQAVREEIDVEPRQFGDDRAHPHGPPCRHPGGEFRIDGNELLRRRPMSWIVEPLRQAGADIVYEVSQGRLPTLIRGSSSSAPSTIRSTSSARSRCRRCSSPGCKAAVKRSSPAAPRRGIIPSACCVTSASRSRRRRPPFA